MNRGTRKVLDSLIVAAESAVPCIGPGVEEVALKKALAAAKKHLVSVAKAAEVRDRLLRAEVQRKALARTCKHPRYIAADKDESPSAKCATCGKHGPWFCSESPNGLCVYAPADTCRDECIYCGDPEERK